MSYNNLDDNSDKLSQPHNITIQLMEHQKTAVFAMDKLEKEGKLYATDIAQYGDNMNFNIDTTIGILADKVGSGKSLMVVTLINNSKIPIQRDTYWIGSKFVAIKSTFASEPIPTNLLLIPHKLMPQWIEFFKHAPNLKVDSYKSIDDEKRINSIDDLKNIDVIIVSCTKSTSFFNKFSNTKWSRVIVDEADSIKLSSNTTFNASFVWLVTATPKSLRYANKVYLTRIFKNIAPWAFDYLIVKNNLEFIDKSIVLPTPKRVVINCITPRELEIIKNYIPKNILSMINAGNTDEAIKSLNCNVNTNDNILKVVTNNISEAINNKKLELDCEEKKIYHNQKAKDEQIDKIKKYKKCIDRLQTRYDAIKEKIYNLNDQYCPICMDEFNTPTLTNCCQNVFCFECLTLSSAKNGLCPFCKKTMFKENLHIIDSGIKKENEVIKVKELKEKLDELIDILEKNPSGKFLLFANFPQTFDKIKTELVSKSIPYKILKGTTGLVQKTIDDFKDGKIRVIMLNAKFFGAGMNLQMATHVVIYHRFENDLEEQVIGRAQRLGRIEPLNVVYLIHDNETSSFTNKDKFEDVDYDNWIDHIDDNDNDNDDNTIDNNTIDNCNTVNKNTNDNNLIIDNYQEEIMDQKENESIGSPQHDEEEMIVVKPRIKNKGKKRKSSRKTQKAQKILIAK